MQREFERTYATYGGKSTRHFVIRCGACKRREEFPVNAMRCNIADDSREQRMAENKFKRAGWEVSNRRPADDRCPDCRKHKENPMANTHAQQTNSKPNGADHDPDPVYVPPPPEAHFPNYDQKGYINIALQQHYESPVAGYKSGWTDSRVAADLGYPVEWVAEIRENMFGPVADNPEIRAVVDEARAFCARVDEKHALMQRFGADMDAKLKAIDDVVRSRCDTAQQTVARFRDAAQKEIKGCDDEIKRALREIRELAGELGPLQKRIDASTKVK